MDTKLDALLKKLKHLEEELLVEVQAKEQQFRYEIRQRKVHFKAEVSGQHRKLIKKLHRYLTDANWGSFITAPVIWSCAVPIVLLDLWATAYQFICFPAYGIPKVRWSDYVVSAAPSRAPAPSCCRSAPRAVIFGCAASARRGGSWFNA